MRTISEYESCTIYFFFACETATIGIELTTLFHFVEVT